ncbi:MAG: hypothetical protein IJ419_07340 [Agathobacter sp.]|nr:hypothetical protein [Agathobacter sp.]
MKFSKIKSENMRLGDDVKVPSTVTRQATVDEFSSGVFNKSASISTKIKDAILSIEVPFNKVDLLHILRAQHNIDNPVLTDEVLDNLCDNGFLRYTEIDDNIWAFVKVRWEEL